MWTPLEEALYWNSRDTIELLIERRAAVRSLAAAAGLGHLEAIDGFLDGQPLRVDAGPVRSPFPDTVPNELANEPRAIIDDGFVMAANTGQLVAAKRLHAACWRGDPAMVTWLATIGADPTIRDGLVDADATGWATHHGYPELVPLLQRGPRL